MSQHVIDFQKKNGLKPDGDLGRKTALKMMQVWGLNREQFANLTGNTHNETGGFKVDVENLNYSGQGMANTWPSRYSANGKPNARALQIAKLSGIAKQMTIANEVYSNRMGNGSPESLDGWRFRGRGSLQLTGKGIANPPSGYIGFEKWLRENGHWRSGDTTLLENPELVATEYFWETALFFFTVNKLWTVAKKIDDETIKKIRKITNGGLIGLKEVSQYTYFYYIMTA